MYTYRVYTKNLHNHWFVLRYGLRIVSACVLDAAMHFPAYLHTFIGCDKTPVFTQALKIQKLNERNDVQCCVPLLVVTLHTWITHGRHSHTRPDVEHLAVWAMSLKKTMLWQHFSEDPQHHGVCRVSVGVAGWGVTNRLSESAGNMKHCWGRFCVKSSAK